MLVYLAIQLYVFQVRIPNFPIRCSVQVEVQSYSYTRTIYCVSIPLEYCTARKYELRCMRIELTPVLVQGALSLRVSGVRFGYFGFGIVLPALPSKTGTAHMLVLKRDLFTSSFLSSRVEYATYMMVPVS